MSLMTHISEIMFAERLRTERARRGLSQTELARRVTKVLGYTVDGTAITRIEIGQRRARLAEAVVIANELGVSLSSLLSNRSLVEAQIDELEVKVTDARAALNSAGQELRRRGAIVEDLQAELDNLKDQAGDDEDRAEVIRDAEDWRRGSLGL